MSLDNRALTDTQKEEVVARLLEAWKRLDQLRLGQLLIAANQGDIFYTEDYILIERIERFIADHPDSLPPQSKKDKL